MHLLSMAASAEPRPAFPEIATAPVATAPATAGPAPMVRMMKGQDIVLCRLPDVCYFEAYGKYTRVVLREQDGLLQMGLQAVEAKLPIDLFVRIHRSFVVNLSQVHKVRRDEMGRLRLCISGRTEQLRISRPHEHFFRAGIF